ncbi:LysM peptidoglycan-binding domain-containing protein [Microbacterium aurantiacum]|uniref:LysM peptidoglycan-binding domain-containing protein n=1 Tax=Microbacterium aurantiacum TaxID=162393 RepID=UPI000C7FFF6C|nr:LysM domain-containing protein [Microbacterium aurantiacum]
MSTRNSLKQEATAERPESPEESTAPAEAHLEASDGFHVVQDGETLNEIAGAFDVPVSYLQRLNAIKRPELVWPGMPLRVR